MAHPLLAVLLDAVDGVFPEPDGLAEIVEPLEDGSGAVVAFTAHSIVATHLTLADLEGVPFHGYGGTMHPATLLRLADGGTIGVHDVVLAAHGRGREECAPPRTVQWDDHPRVRFARSLRRDVVVHGDDRGFVTIGTGVAGRREVSVQVEPESGSSRGTGRALIAGALDLVPEGEPLFAVVSPGNARSLRAFLSQGFVPLGSEVLLGRPGGPDPAADRDLG